MILRHPLTPAPARHHHLRSERETVDANAARPPAVLEAILSVPINEMGSKTGKRIGELVQILVSTTLSLFAKTRKAMGYRFNKSAIKLHLLLDPDSQFPTWFQITPARLHDSRVCDNLPLTTGATYVFDRAYNNTKGSRFWPSPIGEVVPVPGVDRNDVQSPKEFGLR